VARLAARIRVPLLFAVVVVLLTEPWTGLRLPWWVAIAAIAGALALYAVVGRVRAEPVPVLPPVRGSWRAVNSPSTRVPSHGIHAYGQTYAIDLVRAGGPGLSWRPLARRPSDFPGFGQPVLAAEAGRVVRVRQGQRDHWSRTSVPGLIYVLVESMLRELLGPGRVLGNHIVVDQGDGRYAVYAHLQRRSVTVRPGDRVTAGQQIARCGNSGNSTEPHLHFQIMDGPRPAFAAGLPFTFTDGPVPRSGELLGQAASSADSRSMVSPTSRA
jgi:hypothetical protein